MTNERKLKCLIEDIVQSQLKQAGYSVHYLTPEQLCDRWQVTMKTLEKWRLLGKPPVYMKVQGSQKAIIRYPLRAANGILDVEAKWLRTSTSDTEAPHESEEETNQERG